MTEVLVQSPDVGVVTVVVEDAGEVLVTTPTLGQVAVLSSGPTGPAGPEGPPGPPGSDADVTAHEAAADPHTAYLLAAGDTMTGPLRMSAQPVRVVMPGGPPDKGGQVFVWADGVLVQSFDEATGKAWTSLQFDPAGKVTTLGSTFTTEDDQTVRLMSDLAVQAVKQDGTPFLATFPDHVVTKAHLDAVALTQAAADARYVNVTGDTMGGPLIVQNDLTVNWLSSKFGADMGGYKITAVANGTAAGDAVNKGQLDGKVAKTGDTMTGQLNVAITGNMDALTAGRTDGDSWITADSKQPVTNTWAGVYLSRLGVRRWVFGKSATAESGSNSGSHFHLRRYDDAGNVIASVFSVLRDTGVMETVAPTVGGKTLPLHDTGDRSITSGFLNGASGTLILRRSGNTVIAIFHPITTGSSGVFYRPPAGFTIGYTARGVVATSSSTAGRVYDTGGDLTTNITLGTGFYGQLVWMTNDAWPTSLPGTAV